MSIRRKLTAGGATAALVLGGVFAGSPAYAENHSWSGRWTSKATCQAETAKKVAALKKQKVTSLTVRATCKVVGGAYWSQFSWQTR